MSAIQVRQGGGRITGGGGKPRGTTLTRRDDLTAPITFFPDLTRSLEAQRGANNAALPADHELNKRVIQFNSRFSIDFTKKLNEDMAATINNPQGRITQINKEYDNIAMKLSVMYAVKWKEFKDAGYDDEKSTELADEYIIPLIKAEIETLKMKYPYSFDAQGAIQEAMMQSQGMRNAARFIKRSKKYKALKASL